MMSDRVVLGRIGKAHGLKGAFRLWPYAENTERFADLKTVTLTTHSKSMSVQVTRVRQGNGFVLIETEEFDSPEDVRPWVNGELEIDATERVTLPEGQYFHDQIIGLRVQTTDGRDMGEVVEIIENAASDVYVCRRDDQEFLIPAVAKFVTRIDIETGIMTIDPIPGLLE